MKLSTVNKYWKIPVTASVQFDSGVMKLKLDTASSLIEGSIQIDASKLPDDFWIDEPTNSIADLAVDALKFITEHSEIVEV